MTSSKSTSSSVVGVSEGKLEGPSVGAALRMSEGMTLVSLLGIVEGALDGLSMRESQKERWMGHLMELHLG